MKQVIKGDGSIVPFDRQKLVLSMRAAGASEATSRALAFSRTQRASVETGE